MDFVNKNIEKYVEALSDKESPLLREINEYTIDNVHQPRMLSGHLQGRILSFISKIKQPKNILEIGTYTGYSALCLAEGLDKGGKLITIDRDKTLHDKVYDFFKRSEYSKNIEQIIGEAIHLIPEIDLKFDLVFIDADKKNYKNYFDQVLDKLNIGGIVIVDNVLWKGKVTDLSKNQNDKIAVYMNDFNEYIKNNSKVSKLILPVRDGLTFIIKNEN
jgi:predicted O-methyltransferase YrrM|tara:strand:- start:5666 stop:6316 length:651 start_codon:yes stop_codon:yes gene_type:complete